MIVIANELELRAAISRIGNLRTLEERRAAAAVLLPALNAFVGHYPNEPEYAAAWREELDASVED